MCVHLRKRPVRKAFPSRCRKWAIGDRTHRQEQTKWLILPCRGAHRAPAAVDGPVGRTARPSRLTSPCRGAHHAPAPVRAHISGARSATHIFGAAAPTYASPHARASKKCRLRRRAHGVRPYRGPPDGGVIPWGVCCGGWRGRRRRRRGRRSRLAVPAGTRAGTGGSG